jgi:hypothetical protein
MASVRPTRIGNVDAVLLVRFDCLVCPIMQHLQSVYGFARLACSYPLLPHRRRVPNAVVSRLFITGMPGGREGVA